MRQGLAAAAFGLQGTVENEGAAKKNIDFGDFLEMLLTKRTASQSVLPWSSHRLDGATGDGFMCW
jgi:hypothetical protein